MYIRIMTPVDFDDKLLSADEDTGADLVFMAAHIPNVVNRIWPSNGGNTASRFDSSVFVVR